jgi:arylsulfatase A
VKYLEENKESPFFMYVAFNIPHYPEQPDSKFDKRYESLKMPRKSYAKMVSTVDDRMGLILSKLEELKLRDNTVVIFMSDNGHSAENKRGIEVNDHASGFPKDHYYSAHGGGGNTGKWIGQKGSFLEGGIRVPAIISYPSELPQGAVRDQAISATDWFPTILDLCDVERPNVKLDGFSVLPLIASAATPSQHKVMHWGWSSGWAVREGTWKLIGIRDTPKQLVRLDEDLPERTNHLKTQPDVALRLLKLHNAWLTETTGK